MPPVGLADGFLYENRGKKRTIFKGILQHGSETVRASIERKSARLRVKLKKCPRDRRLSKDEMGGSECWL
ncbi:hypothetical protein DAMNIGENAA_02390 [Desulforhabdus amnigena]|uniref:Uncharacterized protein n=1 Tax=Desulforhabdus amnigena TaxID=40218 RepID=A0A9W6CVU8_9BACT|nr:hypothetical protein DAMNIGENAA_02390 [Desulforhabdus amnigena]